MSDQMNVHVLDDRVIINSHMVMIVVRPVDLESSHTISRRKTSKVVLERTPEHVVDPLRAGSEYSGEHITGREGMIVMSIRTGQAYQYQGDTWWAVGDAYETGLIAGVTYKILHLGDDNA